MRFVSRTVEAVPPAAAAALLVLLQLLVAADLGQGQGWPASTGDKVLAGVLLAVQVVLAYAVVLLVGGRTAALFAGAVLVLGPLVLAERYFQSGGGTQARPYLVTHIADEYDLLAVLGKEAASQRQVNSEGGAFDVITCSDASELWFDVTPGFTSPVG